MYVIKLSAANTIQIAFIVLLSAFVYINDACIILRIAMIPVVKPKPGLSAANITPEENPKNEAKPIKNNIVIYSS